MTEAPEWCSVFLTRTSGYDFKKRRRSRRGPSYRRTRRRSNDQTLGGPKRSAKPRFKMRRWPSTHTIQTTNKIPNLSGKWIHHLNSREYWERWDATTRNVRAPAHHVPEAGPNTDLNRHQRCAPNFRNVRCHMNPELNPRRISRCCQGSENCWVKSVW